MGKPRRYGGLESSRLDCQVTYHTLLLSASAKRNNNKVLHNTPKAEWLCDLSQLPLP
jgi:hypothetical protein